MDNTPDQIKALLEVDGKLDKAVNMVGRLCEGSQEWVMHIPARPDKDPDIVISNALHASRLAMRQMVKDIKELRKLLLGLDDGNWTTLEKTCPKCCPDGDDPDWSPFGNEDWAVCFYSECQHPLTVINLKQKKAEILTATAHYEEIADAGPNYSR